MEVDVSLKRSHIIRRLSMPPQRLIRKAVTPLVIRANIDLNTATASPYGKPREAVANIVTIFEKPGFTPGTGTNGGIRASI